MKKPDYPADDARRLAELRSLATLDRNPEERFDRITRLAQRLFGVPTALVSLVEEDCQWFKSRIGFDSAETSRDISFCAHAILNDGIMMIPDATKDERFSNNPLVLENPKVRFYAGCPIIAPSGAKLGTLCILDDRPRELSDEELNSLRDLAGMVEDEIATNKMVVTDPLTGLGNRRGFDMAASVVLEINRRRKVDTALLYFDLDGFKAINDQLGHAEGDRALCEFAELMRSVLRLSDVIARLGGDEFAALLSGTSDHESVVRRMDSALAARNQRGNHQCPLEVSIGVAVAKWGEDEELESLVNQADKAMYSHKRRRD